MWVVTPFFFQGLHLTICLLRLRLSTPLQCNEMRLAGNLLSFCALYEQRGHTKTGPQFKVSSKRPEKRGVNLAIPGLVV